MLRACLILLFNFAIVLLVQAAGDGDEHEAYFPRQLVSFNKLTFGQLAALEILMKDNDRYTHAHVVFSGLRDHRRAGGHFYDWMRHCDRMRESYNSPLPRFITYDGRGGFEDPQWGDPQLLGFEQRADYRSVKYLRVTRDETYDIHQMAFVPVDDHRRLRARISQNGGKIGTVYLQWGHNLLTDDPETLSWYHRQIIDAYGADAERVVVLHPRSLNEPAEFLSPAMFKHTKLPPRHLDLAKSGYDIVDFTTYMLLQAHDLVYGKSAPLLFVPDDLRADVRPDRRGTYFATVRRLVQRAYSGESLSVRFTIDAWIQQARARIDRTVLRTSKQKAASRIIKDIWLALYEKPKPAGVIDFGDALFAVVMLSPEEYASKLSKPSDAILNTLSTIDETESPTDSGNRASSQQQNTASLPQETASSSSSSSRIFVYKNLPREKLLQRALRYTSERETITTKIRNWVGRVFKTPEGPVNDRQLTLGT